MAENQPPPSAPGATPNGDVPGQPFYERTRSHLKDLLGRKRILERNLQLTEETIYKKETEYLEETPAGNIITGFEQYTKGNAGTIAGGARRRAQVVEGNRVFSRSSISFGPGADSPIPTAQSTPMAAMAPTPLSTSFVKGDGSSNHPTPTSASSASKMGNAAGAGKKNKKNGEDSDGEGRESKKIRTNFGAVRK
ncbi:histone acetyltransferase subunit NuA4-domain-containing protein [Tricladium varicosporioides]|nr:histone acetyltransferase subunit NuA4-domain-containing protein [Hymenoscyphus varicosporioides]